MMKHVNRQTPERTRARTLAYPAHRTGRARLSFARLRLPPLRRLAARCRSYLQESAGAIAPLFAVLLPVLIGATGMAVEVAQAYLVRERLMNALDSSALAAAASSDDADIAARVQDFFDNNYPPEKIGVPYDLIVTIDGDDIRVQAKAAFDTVFLRLIGVGDIDVGADAAVRREVKGLEIVLVLDYTGSMGSWYGGRRNIERLQEAATLFINTIFDRAENDELVKVSIVPYSTSVNVGPYGLGLNPDGSDYGTPFVNNPQNLDYEMQEHYGRNKADGWGGCVLTDGYDDDVSDHDGPWDMYRWCRRQSDDYPICDYYTYYGNRYPNREPNYICSTTHIVPLTSDQQGLLDTIDGMDRPQGNTLGNIGMLWGWRVISPKEPFPEATAYDDEYWRKAILMMTDGVNVLGSTYSAYGKKPSGMSSSTLNERFEETCENIKEHGVTIYTVTFTSGVNEYTKDYYRRCASQESYYFDSAEPDDLVGIFGRIGRELSNLHLIE